MTQPFHHERTQHPLHLKKQGATLFNQQMWCWGQDIRRAEGNLLLEYGFTRRRPPEGVVGSSSYVLQTQEQHTVTLWGFGLFYTHSPSEGIFLKRYSFTPRLALNVEWPLDAWALDQLPALSLPSSPRKCQAVNSLLTSLLSWISAYETWVLQTQGLAYSYQCLAAWGEVACPAEAIVSQWQHLADAYTARSRAEKSR
ncbi:hypothetical protein [Ktedonobacter robiniae]|uniref:Uncharacterized protein n=1 Tax=Ktedonobacter robiniae TaxID=2778365 RepID=A0ABQ3V6U0_9CHLR|nr:hypothetical protein [Ktedonobacter robiniae]GHO60773.1 hypothetical protein KSB_92480 [Ktedonobacter robiniae]